MDFQFTEVWDIQDALTCSGTNILFVLSSLFCFNVHCTTFSFCLNGKGELETRLHAETTNFTVLLIGDELGLKGSDMPYLGLYLICRNYFGSRLSKGCIGSEV